MEKRIKLKVSEIVRDFSFYFREHTDPQHVRYMRHALESDAEFPPCVVDFKSHKLIDGYHRLAMYQSVKGDDHVVDCIAKSYESDNAMFLDSLRLNRDCKRGITTNDQVRCVILAQQRHISMKQLAEALGINAKFIRELSTGRIGFKLGWSKKSGNQIPLKRTIEHKSGCELTEDQEKANDKLSGQEQAFYARQLLILLKNDLLDTENETLMGVLQELHEILSGIFCHQV